MAITKLMHMKSAKSGSASSHLKNAINYILNEKKVASFDAAQQQYAASQGCILKHAYKDMMQTKEQYGKTDGRQGYHFIISFRPGEASKEQLWEITQGFVKEYLKGYEAVYAIHDDTDHLHAHIVFNSVNYETGYKYHYKNGDWEEYIQPIVDRLCMENGAPALEYHTDEYDQDGVKREFHSYSKNFSWTREVKADIDECIKMSESWADFIGNMQQKGYSINYGKSVSVRKAGMKKAKRLKERTMGYEYTPEGIIERIHIQSGRYRLSSAGTAIGSHSILPTQQHAGKKYKRYAGMDFLEKAMVRHMLRIRNAIPEYRDSPGSWYAKRKTDELHRTEQQLTMVREYKIADEGDIKRILTELGNKEKEIMDTIKHQEFISKEYKDLLNAYKTATDYENGADTPYEKYSEAAGKIKSSGESMESIRDYTRTAEENRDRYKTEIKNIKRQKAVLMGMLKKEKHENSKNNNPQEKDRIRRQRQRGD